MTRVSYELDGVTCQREVFSSHSDQVLVVRLTANRPAALTLQAKLSRPEPASVLNLVNDQLVLHGQMWDGELWSGVRLAARMLASTKGGTVTAVNGGLSIGNADEVTLYLTAATDYQMQLPEWRQGSPAATTAGQLASAELEKYSDLRPAHIKDQPKIFWRALINLGEMQAASEPADLRLNAVPAAALTRRLLPTTPTFDVICLSAVPGLG